MAALVVNYKSKDGRFTTQFSGDGLNQIFEALSKFQEVFEKNNVCGACGSVNVLFNTRKVQKSKFYEKKCAEPKCGAALTYHSNEEGGGLYTTYKDKWEKWAPGKHDDDGDEEVPKRVSGSKK